MTGGMEDKPITLVQGDDARGDRITGRDGQALAFISAHQYAPAHGRTAEGEAGLRILTVHGHLLQEMTPEQFAEVEAWLAEQADALAMGLAATIARITGCKLALEDQG